MCVMPALLIRGMHSSHGHLVTNSMAASSGLISRVLETSEPSTAVEWSNVTAAWSIPEGEGILLGMDNVAVLAPLSVLLFVIHEWVLGVLRARWVSIVATTHQGQTTESIQASLGQERDTFFPPHMLVRSILWQIPNDSKKTRSELTNCLLAQITAPTPTLGSSEMIKRKMVTGCKLKTILKGTHSGKYNCMSKNLKCPRTIISTSQKYLQNASKVMRWFLFVFLKSLWKFDKNNKIPVSQCYAFITLSMPAVKNNIESFSSASQFTAFCKHGKLSNERWNSILSSQKVCYYLIPFFLSHQQFYPNHQFLGTPAKLFVKRYRFYAQ